MEYKAYGKVVTTPSRMARKSMRRSVFLFNKQAKKIQRKASRLKRKSLEQGE